MWVVMACFERQGRVSSGCGAERRRRRTWGPLESSGDSAQAGQDCLDWPEAHPPCSVVETPAQNQVLLLTWPHLTALTVRSKTQILQDH